MFDLPLSTVFNHRIPKQKFYEKGEISASAKRSFVEEIKEIRWTNKLSSKTLNVAAGGRVTEIEVIHIAVATGCLDEAVLRLIDKAIPYHTLLLLLHDGKYQAWISFKEESSEDKETFKVNRYFHTDWMSESELPIRLDGLSLDEIYENFVRQVAGDELQAASGEGLKTDFAQSEMRRKVKQEIARLEKLARAEKQPKKKFELVQKIKTLKENLI